MLAGKKITFIFVTEIVFSVAGGANLAVPVHINTQSVFNLCSNNWQLILLTVS